VGQRAPNWEDSAFGFSSLDFYHIKKDNVARHRWLTSVIPATQEAEIRRLTVQSQPGQIVFKTLS
jgi:hypothetical protein